MDLKSANGRLCSTLAFRPWQWHEENFNSLCVVAKSLTKCIAFSIILVQLNYGDGKSSKSSSSNSSSQIAGSGTLTKGMNDNFAFNFQR